ncbi:hypothetical protein U1769_00850 [Sphingomonas sp. ZT3P38]|uniref:hypothetical protein n=1 Tax=Parasphingomonas zepuensis TaxID=3096161 RepID=UPI002FC7EE30
MRWFGSIATALILLILTTILAGYLEPIVKAIFPQRAIMADIQLSRWMERPTKVGIEEEKPSDDARENQSRHDTFFNPDIYKFMSMELLNKGDTIAENVHFRLEDGSRPDTLIVTDDGNKRQFITGKNDIPIPNIKPGEKVRVYLWATYSFSTLLTPDSLKSYSSVGPFETSYATPSGGTYYGTSTSPFYDFLDTWAPLVGFFAAIGLIILFSVAIHMQEKYMRALLSDQSFYDKQKLEYDADPKKFVPSLKG